MESNPESRKKFMYAHPEVMELFLDGALAINERYNFHRDRAEQIMSAGAFVSFIGLIYSSNSLTTLTSLYSMALILFNRTSNLERYKQTEKRELERLADGLIELFSSKPLD